MYLQQKTPSAHDGFVRLYNWPCSTDVPIALTVAKSTLFAFFTGVYLCAVFSSKPSMQMLCFRVENGYHEGVYLMMVAGIDLQLNDDCDSIPKIGANLKVCSRRINLRIHHH